MMRDIKFRAWDEDDKVLRSWEELILDKEDGDDYWMVGYKENKVVTSYNHKQILMQYTGNTDKNGKEIYEDDLVAEEHGRIYRVVFKGDCWRCEPISRGSKNRWLSDYLKIIGNIYENPELLERSE